MLMLNRIVLSACISAVVTTSGVAHASLAVVDANPDTSNQLADDYTGTIGFEFTVPTTSPVYIVNAVGVYDNQNLSTSQSSYTAPYTGEDGSGDGLVSNHVVAIYNDSLLGIEVASATVTAGTSSSAGTAGFAFQSLTAPLALVPGDTYTVADNVGLSDGDFWLYSPSPTISPDFTDIVGAYGSANSNLTNFGGTPYIGPSFEYSTVPEPLSMGLMGAAGLLLLSRRRSRMSLA